MSDKKHNFVYSIEGSAIWAIIGIVLLFSTSIIVILISPRFVDPTWTQPTTPYQVQMYEVADPNLYISNSPYGERELVYHIQNDFTLLAFQEYEQLRIIAPSELEKFITLYQDKDLKLTSQLLLLRIPEPGSEMAKKADEKRKQLQKEWDQKNPGAKKDVIKPAYDVLELYAPKEKSAFARVNTDGILENWVDHDFTILDQSAKQPYHQDKGVIYILNPQEYRISYYNFNGDDKWRFNPDGEPIPSLQLLKEKPFNFLSRQELIQTGEQIYKIEGCWYCHTDQTRTLIQDVVLNGSESYPAPPSSANEYIYQYVTFPGTRRIGPDISRTGVKRQSRDWHMGHFWSPKTASAGSIMPSFRHFFDYDPRGTGAISMGVPNYKFEAIFQYLMTKGTRITPPTEAWWLGKDPIKTKEIIEGLRKIP